MKTKSAAPDLNGAIAGMQALKAEHAPILAQLARDPGMAPETRALLVTHLLEEEDEKLAGIAAAAGARGSASSGKKDGVQGARWTIGSLRMSSSGAGAAESAPQAGGTTSRQSVGSLRAR